MKKMAWIVGLLAAAIAIGVLWIEPGIAQANSLTEKTWLSFDGDQGPADPTMILLETSAEAINLEADLPGAWIETITVKGQNYTRFSGTGYGFPEKVGFPEVPVLRQAVEIPFGAQVRPEIISVAYSEHALQDLGLNPIYPLQPPLVKSEQAEQSQGFVIDQQYYANGASYPSSPLSLGQEYIVRGHRLLPVEIWPVSYDPTSGKIRLYSQVIFRLRLTGSDMRLTQSLARRYASPAFESRLSRDVLNYNQGKGAVLFEPQTPVGYLIIVADPYYDAMLPFVSLRESRGFEVTMRRTSEIPGGATPAGIKAYIQDAYDHWPIPPSYVLLVGDTDTVPTWNGPIIYTATDLYYGTMDGDNDWHPDLGRGRFPVRSAAQATIMVNKYLAYALLSGQEPWLRTASFPATCDQYLIAEGTHNYVIENYTQPGGYWGTFPNNPQPGGDKLYCRTYNADHDDLVTAFNQGRWVIIYSGHGSHSGWEMDFSSNDVRNLTNYGMFPFVASHACVSGDFGQYEVYGETWVLQENKGALAYWGSSNNSYWGEDDILERVMWDALFAPVNPRPDVATVTDAGLAGVEIAYPSRARYYWETYNVLGDPAVKIFLEPDLPTFTLDITPDSHQVCTAGVLTSTVEIGSIQNYSETVFLLAGAPPENVGVSFDPEQAQAPYSSILTLEVSPGAPVGDHTLLVTATDQISRTLDRQVHLRIVNTLPAAPSLLSPADGEQGLPLQPEFTWQALPLVEEYAYQLDQSPLFETPLIDAEGLTAASFTPAAPLLGGRCFWWRVKAENACGVGAWAEPFHFATVALGLGFSDDIEAGSRQWFHQALIPPDNWKIVADQSHSPTHSWQVDDYDEISDSYLRNLEPVMVGNGSMLTFWHRYNFESSYDGAVLEISVNGGVSWTDLGPYITANGYNGTISSCCGNPLGGRAGWVQDLGLWTKVEVNLSAFAGQNILVRWRFGSDSSIGDLGWYIDDVQISIPLHPLPPPTVAQMTPNHSSGLEPTPVQILGSNFVDMPAARLGDTWLISMTLVSSTTLNAVVPAGIDSGTYTLTLYNGDCQMVTLENAFSVGDHLPPDVVDDAAETDEDTASSIDVLANDHDPEGAPLSLISVGNPAHGNVVISGTVLIYTPEVNYYGTDSFTYTASDGEFRDSADVLITIWPVNDPPVIDRESVRIDPTAPYAGQPFTLTASITDVDLDDAHRVTIAWASGVSQTLDLVAGQLEFVVQHSYPAPGLYPAIITVSDLAGGETSTTFEILVSPSLDLYRISLPLIKKQPDA